MALLDTGDIEDFLATSSGWELSGSTILKTFTFSDFAAAMVFVNRVAHAAETAGHHPDIDIRWNRVTLALSTHSEGGLTRQDTDLAREIDSLG